LSGSQLKAPGFAGGYLLKNRSRARAIGVVLGFLAAAAMTSIWAYHSDRVPNLFAGLFVVSFAGGCGAVSGHILADLLRRLSGNQRHLEREERQIAQERLKLNPPESSLADALGGLIGLGLLIWWLVSTFGN